MIQYKQVKACILYQRFIRSAAVKVVLATSIYKSVDSVASGDKSAKIFEIITEPNRI